MAINQRITIASLITLLKTGLLGFVTSEIIYLALSIGDRIVGLGDRNWVLGLGVLGLILVGAYMFARGAHRNFQLLLGSGRWDILLVFFLGIFLNVSFGGVGTQFYPKIFTLLSLRQLTAIVSAPIIIGLLLIIRAIQMERRDSEEEAPFFISDAEKKYAKEDLLDFAQQAERFAERVFNQGSSDSIVFGIDAPWGIGKSTFINFCREHWQKNSQNKAIVYNFHPLRFEGGVNLLEKFIDGLIRAIQKDAFLPEIKPLLSKYSRFIQNTKGGISLLGIQIEASPGKYTIDDALEDLDFALKKFDKKILVVVDDLDRLSFAAIKDVLFAVKKSFTLPNISYVLCYDAENISVLEKDKADTEKITEFLEKFVNVKVSIFIDSRKLSSYITENIEKVLVGNSQADPKLVSKAIGGLGDIYNSPEYHKYLPFVGDVRKLKRLINTLLLLEIEKANFDDSDFDKKDLIHLLLIYINYPSIFRKIYNTETGGKRGFFSVALPYDDNYPGGKNARISESQYKNSTDYTEYLETLSSENQKFLLNQVFDVEKRLRELKVSTQIDNVPQEIKTSLACFNGDGGWTGGRNLEEYLNLIVKLSRPQSHGQFKFYANRKNEIMEGKTMEEVLQQYDEFSYNSSEHNHEQLWRVLINSAHEFSGEVGARLIRYLLNNINKYSLLTSKEIGLGLRDDLDFLLVKLLDKAGWVDEDGKHVNNTTENLTEIAEWVFGEGRHQHEGALAILSQEDRGILGLYDLLCFRLFCSSDRGGDIFNLQRALSSHADPNAPTEGLTTNIAIEEMREISQKVFAIFKGQYIDTKKNIFDLINQLSLKDFAGEYLGYVQSKVESGEISSVDEEISALKSRIKSFITYQLGNSLVSMGVGCGYYDARGKGDNKGIRAKMNEYLFGVCFNPADDRNFEHFLDYLLINFSRTFERGYKPSINELVKVLELSNLKDYWQKNSAAIKALNLQEKDKVVDAVNYKVSYKEDLQRLFAELDRMTSQ